MTDKTREDFHSWMRYRFWVGVNLVRSPDGYVSTVSHPSLPMTYASVEMMWESYQAATQHSAARIAELEAEVQALRRDAERLDWIAMHGTFGVDSVTGIPGGNGQTRKAATRRGIDTAIESERAKP